MEASVNDLQERILQTINAKRWTHLDEFWIEALAEDYLPLEFHEPIIEKLVHRQDNQHFTHLYEPYLDSLLEKGRYEEALELSEAILGASERQEWVRPRLVTAIEMNYGETFGERLGAFLIQSGLRDEAVPIGKAFRAFNDLLGARKGQVFVHTKWGVGIVRDLDLDTSKVIIDFELEKNKVLTLEGVRSFLRRLPADHIQARIVTHTEELKDQTKRDPAEVIRHVLKSVGSSVKVGDMKKILTTRFLTENEYKRFWENARKAIKIDPWIDSTGSGANTRLSLRATPRSFFDEIVQTLVTAKDATARREVLRDVRRHGSDAEMTPEDSEALFQLFIKPVNDGVIKDDGDKLRHGLLFLEFGDLFEERENPVDIDSLLKMEDVVELLRELDVAESRRLALERLITLRPDDWAELFAEAMILLDARTAAWAERELAAREKDHERQVALESIIAKPDANPDLFVWAAKNLLEGTWKNLGESFPLTMICEELLSLLSELSEEFDSSDGARAAAARNSGTKVRNLLADNNCRYFKRAIQTSTTEESRRILQDIFLHNALSHQLKSAFERTIIEQHPELRQVSRLDIEEERKKPSFHYTTRQALDDKRAALSKLISQDIPAMAHVIQAARELGDLRENSEYHAAKDRQKLLMQQAAELEDLIARARVVEAREVTPETTRFGTKVHYREMATGELREVTLLGMWEADLPQNIISYLTPFGSQLLGKRLGEQFSILQQDGSQMEITIEQIDVAFPSGGESR